MLQSKSQFLGYHSDPVEQPEHKASRQVLDYWNAKRQENGPLRRVDLNPAEIAAALPGVFVAEKVDDTFRFRLVGSDVEARMRRVVTGMTLQEIYGEEIGAKTADMYADIIRTGKPLCLQGNFVGDNLEHARIESLMLPLEFESGSPGIVGTLFDLN